MRTFLRWAVGVCVAGCGARSSLDVDTQDAKAKLVCPATFAHCVGPASGGCETDLGSSIENCGSCGNVCAMDQVCARGACHSGRDIVQVACGGWYTCALRASGQVLCWGKNEEGELGRGFAGVPGAIAPVLGLDDAVELSEGATCARHRTGAVSCWGENSVGEVGDGTTENRPAPTAVLDILDAAQLSRSCALRRDATLWCWGPDEIGQLANGIHTPVQLTPSRVLGLDGIRQFESDGNATCAVDGVNELWCWGYNGAGWVGDGTLEDRDTPVPIAMGMVRVDGTLATCAIDVAQHVSCWGEPFPSVPAPVDHLTQARKVALGVYHRCALRSPGDVVCWGNSADNFGKDHPVYGLLGDGGKTVGGTAVPVEVLGLIDAVDLSAGSAHTCALRANGQIVCWGDNTYGQLGDGTTTAALAPVAVVGLP